MEIPEAMRKNLMKLAGISDETEFNNLVAEIAPNMKVNKAGKQASPFHVHYMEMVGLVEAKGVDNFLHLNSDLHQQLAYVHDIIYPDYKDVRKMVPKKEETETDFDKMEKSKMIRDRGNKAYQKKDFSRAIGLYSESVLCAPLNPEGKSREAALGLGNRSAVFFQKGDWCECLDDIEAAILFGYPAELVYRLHDRKARCLEQLGRHSEAAASFEVCILTVSESNLKEERREEVIAEAKTLMASLTKETRESSEKQKIPFTIWDKHQHFPALIDSATLHYDPSSGRHMRANKPIRAGDVIAIEESLTCHLSPSQRKRCCLHCMKKLGNTVLPSPWVKGVRFCSMECLRKALSSYHQTEGHFDITDLFHAEDETQMSGCISLAYRVLTQKGLQFFKEKRIEMFSGHDIKFGMELQKGFAYSGDEKYRILYNLVNHESKLDADLRVNLVIRSVVLLWCLRTSGFFGTADRSADLSEDELFVGELLYHFQSGMKFNIHTVYKVDGEIESAQRIPLVDIGAALYPTLLFFNHSCCPNSVRINQGSTTIMVAKRNILPGEEITDCYGIHHVSIGKQERLNSLKDGYEFDCKCEACEKDFGLFGQIKATVSPKVATILGTTLSKYKSAFDEKKYEKALTICKDYLSKLEDCKVPYPHRNYEIGNMAMCSCYWAMVK